MTVRKRNEWLDADESEDDERDYFAEEESRAQLLRGSKRQKLDSDLDDDQDAEEEGQEEDNEDFDNDSKIAGEEKTFEDDEQDIAHLDALAASLTSKSTPPNKPLRVPLKPKKDKSGIIYLSRCPPFMKPSVLRSLLTPYGTVGRIFLTPEPTAQRTQRLKSGGTRRKLFLDGWVEFLKKKDAKFVAENLNAQIMGGKKRGRWHDEVWNIKYLRGVKWSHLVEQIQNENAERQARMRAEIAQSKRENQRFLEDIERGKIAKTMSERKKKRFGEGEDIESGEQEATAFGRKTKTPRREFKQNEVKLKARTEPEHGQDVDRVLSKIF